MDNKKVDFEVLLTDEQAEYLDFLVDREGYSSRGKWLIERVKALKKRRNNYEEMAGQNDQNRVGSR